MHDAPNITATSLSHLLTVIPETGFLRLPQILSIIPVGKSSWWLGVRNGRYPKSVKLSKRCTAWRAEDIRDLIKTLSNAATKN